MELLLDPGHELDLGWNYSSAMRSDQIPVYGGSWAAYLQAFKSGGFPPGADGFIWQEISLKAGDLVTASAAIHPPSASSGNWLDFTMLNLDGGLVIHRDRFRLDALPADTYSVRVHGSFLAAEAPNVRVQWKLENQYTAAVYVDAESVEVTNVPKGYEAAYVALYNRLRGINGSAGGYHHDIGGRVLTRLRVPGRDNLKLPTICCPIDSDLPYDEGEDYLIGRLQVIVIFWVKRDEREGVTDSAAIDCLRAHDDLVKCLMPTESEEPWWNFGENRLLGIEFGTPDLLSEQVEFPPRVRLPVILKVALHPNVLGP